MQIEPEVSNHIIMNGMSAFQGAGLEGLQCNTLKMYEYHLIRVLAITPLSVQKHMSCTCFKSSAPLIIDTNYKLFGKHHHNKQE